MTNQSKIPPIRKYLTMSTLFVLLAIALNAVVVTFSAPPSITIESVIYEVNDQGDLTIQLTGTKTGVSVANANFSIKIPDKFEMETLTDGTPVIEMLSNGTELEKAENSASFRVVFALRTLSTTLLPRHFFLKMDSFELLYSGDITPQWPPNQENQAAGGGAAVASNHPHITSFVAYNSEKGQTVHVKTYIYNPAPYPKYLNSLAYTIKANDYDDWEANTPNYSENRYIWDDYTLVVHDYLANVFTSPGTPVERYALNRGDYDVTRVNAVGPSWSDSYFPNNVDFDVLGPSSGMNVVFVAHLVDQSFRDAFVENSYFDDLENVEFEIAGAGDHTLQDDFDIDFISLVLSWTPGSTNINALYTDLYTDDAKDALGLSDDWDNQQGTSSYNDGFDLLFGHSWEMNTNGERGGIANKPGNSALVMKGFYISEFPEYTDCDLVSLHETFHTFDAYTDDMAHNPSSGYIMHANDIDYDMHSNTKDTLDDNINQYDGVPL